MGNSGGKVPDFEVITPNQSASSSVTARPSAASFSPASRGLLRPPSLTRQQWAPVQQFPPPPLPTGWDFHIDHATGYPYFYNTRTGVSQWQDPRGPGFPLPERSEATNLGVRRQVIPPWEGGPADADPLSWPLPPGWQEQIDPALNQRCYVNYDARILSYNDPRVEIVKAYAQGAVVQGIPVQYPPPAIGRPVDEVQPFEYGQQGGFPPIGSPGRAGTSYLPPPPPLKKKKKNSLWSKLGYRQGRPGAKWHGAAGNPVPAVFLFDHSEVPAGDDTDSSSSSTSYSDSDDDGNDGRDDLGPGGISDDNIFLLPQVTQRERDGSGSDGGGGNSGSGSDDGGSIGGGSSQGDSDAIDEYGFDNINQHGGGGGDIIINLPPMESGGGVSGVIQQSVFEFRNQKAREVYFQGWDDGLKRPMRTAGKFTLLDRYAKIAIVLTVLIGSYCGVFEGVLSFLIAFAGRFIVYFMCKRGKMAKRQQEKSGQKLRDRMRVVFTKKGSAFAQLKTLTVAQWTQMQASFYEHLYEHPLVRMHILTGKDGASPLYSRLESQPREITVVTQATADRLPAIEAMAKSWGGVLCVATYVRTHAELAQVYPRLESLHEQIEAKGLCRLNICVAMEEGLLEGQAATALYPINAMRNVALSMATTELVFILDADFVPSAGMHERLTGQDMVYSEIRRIAVEEMRMLVVPAFERMAQNLEKGVDMSLITYPTEMGELRQEWKEGSAKAFHCSHFPRGHMPTNYQQFFNPATEKPYSVQYREFYEPYTICAREVIPPFDARFRGYGLNKISHAYHCAAMGMRFSVLPHIFVWSLPHVKSQAWVHTFGKGKDPLQKLRVLGLYRRFKSERQLLLGSGKENMEAAYPPSKLEIRVEEPLQPFHPEMCIGA